MTMKLVLSSIHLNIHVYAKLAGHGVTQGYHVFMPNDKQTMAGHVGVLTNQMLVYKYRRVIRRIVIPRIESIAKTPKPSLRINLRISSDLGITNLRLILRF